MPEKCSVILCTFNRLDYLKKSLGALLSLDYSDYEIVIVNDGSTDGTRLYLDTLNNPKIKVVHNEKNLGLSLSKNVGIRHAQYEMIAFTDDDCIVDSQWLKNLLKGFKSKDIAFVIGQVFYVAKDHLESITAA